MFLAKYISDGVGKKKQRERERERERKELIEIIDGLINGK